jgi:hypothetical protein
MTEQYIYGQPVYGQNIQYQTGIQTNPVLVQGANYGYTQQVYLQPQQAGQVYNYQQAGYYQQPVQTNQQKFQQVYQQYPTQQSTVSTVSRNPNIQSQFNNSQQSQKMAMDKPLIESQFQPSIPIANSVIDQSQITFQKKTSQASVGSGNMNDNFMASQISHDEFPIQESIPVTNNLNVDNQQINQQVSQNPFGQSISGDIDVNMSHLPTINSIMKGTKEILPPPKKNKYQ